MNIHIDNFDMREISVELLNRMVYLHSYLEIIISIYYTNIVIQIVMHGMKMRLLMLDL